MEETNKQVVTITDEGIIIIDYLVADYTMLIKLIFQFHKGTIRTTAIPLQSKKQVNFNSIKVRLERLILLFAIFQSFNFNSIKVRLEHPYSLKQNGGILFQFHKGTIRTQHRNRIHR